MTPHPAMRLPGRIGSVFGLMEVAEEVLAERGMSKHPTAFSLLCPPSCLVQLDPRAYRSHCRELLDRVAGRSPVPVDVATEAEVLAHLSGASLVAPPGTQFAALFEELFERVMGELPSAETRTREPWHGATAELLADCRRTLSHAIERKADAVLARKPKRSRRKR